MHKTLKRWLVACCAAAIVIGTVAGLALATDGGGTVAACAKTAGGQLRLDTGDGCLPSEEAVHLGTAAQSRADERFYVAPNLADSSTMLALPNGQFPAVLAHAVRVVTMHVPAGNYALASQITLLNHTGDGSVACVLLDGAGHTHGYEQTSVGIDPGYNRDETITLDGALSLGADDDISLACWNGTGNDGVDPGTALVRAADITTKSVDAASITQETH